MRESFGTGVGGSWVEGGGFFLWGFEDFTEHFRGGGLVESDFFGEFWVTDGFEES